MRQRLVKIAVGVWFAWLVLANVFLQPAIGPRLIAWHPERFAIGWTKAWSLVPGLAHVRGFWCGGHVRTTRWRIEIDRAVVLVNVPALAARTFHGLWPRASGVRATVETTDEYVEPRNRRGAGFRVVLHGVRATDVGHLELAGLGIDGVESVAGTLDTRARGRLAIPHAELRVADGHLEVGGETVAEDLILDARVRIAPYVPTEHRDTGPLPFLSGRVDLDGRLGDLSIVREFVRNTPMVEFEGGRATARGTVTLDRGRVVDPTELTISEATYGVRYLDDVVATGTGRILGGRATGSDGEALRFELESFELARPGTSVPYARGHDLTVRVLSDQLDLLDAGDEVAIVIDVPSAEVLDIGAFDPFLADEAKLELLSGSGRLASRIELDLRSGDGSAELELAADGVAARLGERDLVGDLRVRAQLAARDVRTLRFDIRSLAVDLDDVAVAGERRHRSTGTTGGWWSHLRLEDGSVRLAKPIEMDAAVVVEAMDARPIFALVEDGTAAVGWVDRLVATDDLSGAARIVMHGRSVELRDLELRAGDTRIEAELCVRGEASTMVALAGIRDHHVGLELTANGTDWTLSRPTEWFATRRPQFRCEASPAADGGAR